MKLRNIPFSPPDMTEQEAQEVREAILSGWITTGPRVKELEKKLDELNKKVSPAVVGIVIGNASGSGVIVNPEGLRDQKEFVRHKILDAVGDLYQAGMPIICHFKGNRCGHYHNNMLLRELFKDSSNYEIVDLNEYYKKMNIRTTAVA